MSKYSKEVKEKAIYLSEKGWNSFIIAKELGIPESTVNGWVLKFVSIIWPVLHSACNEKS